MTTLQMLKKLRPERWFRRHAQPRLSWEGRGERISRRALVVTEEEMRTHHRLEAQSAAERYAN
ncbi:hypothetical protein F8S09_07235 [Deinococcus sp. SDU3-2]|uniref:Uncharacterized protein n=1 Tax=Deinococcus terrestris TaxID=2651870 RepID=A0A7X1TRJ7_9DEIO|nr:hypothetical protein [Deinococcus terrestris]MPY66489.1 hypothetical protein [Deinococcus terrestris]